MDTVISISTRPEQKYLTDALHQRMGDVGLGPRRLWPAPLIALQGRPVLTHDPGFFKEFGQSLKPRRSHYMKSQLMPGGIQLIDPPSPGVKVGPRMQAYQKLIRPLSCDDKAINIMLEVRVYLDLIGRIKHRDQLTKPAIKKRLAASQYRIPIPAVKPFGPYIGRDLDRPLLLCCQRDLRRAETALRITPQRQVAPDRPIVMLLCFLE
jgi:hypothetical protein